MKSIFYALLFVLSVQSAFAQVKSDSLKHLTFKGVPIDGTLGEYVSKMKQIGFTHLRTEDGIAMLKGEFAGYKDCYVGISTLKQKDLVHKIVVIFPECDTWSHLSGNYFYLKELLTEKYGKPNEVLEKFDSYSQPNDDQDKMYKVKIDNCKFHSIWQTDKGDIKLSIEHESVIRCFVSLSYSDKINSDIIKSKAIKDL